jgi:hypothetical protein
MSAAAAAAAANLIPSGETGNNVKSAVLITALLVVVIIIFVVFKKGMSIFDGITGSIGSILEGIGIKDSAEDKKANEDAAAADTIASKNESPFNPTFYKTAPAGTPLKTQATLESLCDQVYDSVGSIWDDPEAAFGAFKQCSNWCMVSQIADKFNKLYGKDVYSWLRIKFDTTTQKDILAKIVNHCVKLPKY